MRMAKEDVPVVLAVPGATARQFGPFGTTGDGDAMAAEWFSLAAGVDIAPLLEGLERDTCHAPHWGFLQSGALEITYADGERERVEGGDLFHWPPFHSVRVVDDAEVILFSPLRAHRSVIDHMATKLGVTA